MRDYQSKSNVGGIADSITPEKLGAGEANSFLTESKTAVSSSDQVLAPADGTGEITDQLARALAVYGGGGGEYCIDTGAVNAYVLTPVSPKKSIPAYFDGMKISFRPGADNTGNSTLNYAGIGVKNVRKIGGGPLLAGDITGVTTVVYNLPADRFEVVSRTPIKIQEITVSGNYVPTDGLIGAYVIAKGPGGGGGGAGNGLAGESAGGGAGGEGGEAIAFFPASQLLPSVSVTIGAPGGGAPGLTLPFGGTGGTTTFGSLLTVNGGEGGESATPSAVSNIWRGGGGGFATGGSINIRGGAGSLGVATSSGFGCGGSGGGYGGRSASVTMESDGSAGAYGGGGGGASTGGSSASAATGGDGGESRVIIMEVF